MAGNAVASDDDSVDETPDRKDETSSKKVIPYKTPATPFFTIYKKGQGKWTRLGTAAAGGLLACLTAYNLYEWIYPYLPLGKDPTDQGARHVLMAGCTAVLAILCLIIFWVGNKQSNVDFMIATDGEMKKVNWTTKGELFGSTRVVVLFLIFIGTFLFLVDLLFAQFFKLIHVLQ